MPAVRLPALDALRGLAVALMILVNTPGSWQHVYPLLLHAPWHGFTLADWVFPLFLFAVGSALALGQQPASRLDAYHKIARRTLLLLAIGLMLHAFPFDRSLAELRLPGVLQRIALCYCVVALLVQHLSQRSLWLVAFLLLPGYWLLLWGFSADPDLLTANAVQRLDLWLFGPQHLYAGFGEPFDPEGLLSSLGACSSVLFGYLFTRRLKQLPAIVQGRYLWRMAGLFMVLGGLWQFVWPLNKPLWTGSYVLFSTGLCLLLLRLLTYSLAEPLSRWRHTLLQPLLAFGANPLFIYVLSWLWAVSAAKLIWLPATTAEGRISLYDWGFNLLQFGLPAQAASLVFALLNVALFAALALWLKQRRIFIKL